MITRVMFYLLESALLALVAAGMALPLLKGALRILGCEWRLKFPRAFALVWIAYFAAGVLGGELVGPSFLWEYWLTGFVFLVALGFRLVAPFLAKRVRIVRADLAR